MNTHITNGAFSTSFAKRKTWKINPGLQKALLAATNIGDYILDVGAGIGRYVEWFHDEERFACGIDGTPDIANISDGKVLEVDFSHPDAPDLIAFKFSEPFDLTICIEVIEHIPAELMDTFLDNFTKLNTDRLIVSCAVLNQRGRDHVSCHQPYWVANQFGARGFVIDEPETERLRKIAGKGWDHKLLVFTSG